MFCKSICFFCTFLKLYLRLALLRHYIRLKQNFRLLHLENPVPKAATDGLAELLEWTLPSVP